MLRSILNGILLALLVTTTASSQVVINEIHYNPPDDDLESGAYREFVELYNFSSSNVDLGGYYFERGITYTFPTGTTIQAGSYLVVAKDPSHRFWRSRRRPLGPYEGKLDNSGERLQLVRPDGGTVDDVRYSDKDHWSLAPDGYGASLERIRWNMPSDDYHSWRGSYSEEGTPGGENTVDDVPPYPLIDSYEVTPESPKSTDAVQITVRLDAPDLIDTVTLQWENALFRSKQQVEMQRTGVVDGNGVYQASVPPNASQSLIRCNLLVRLHSSLSFILPHESEPNPFISYFVYDGEVPSLLPKLWVLPPQPSSLIEFQRPISGAVCLKLGEDQPVVFDGAFFFNSNTGQKLRFLKGAEFFGDRTINLSPEIPSGGTNAGYSSPFREYLGYWLYRNLDVVSPWAEFYRVITLSTNGNRHEQRFVFQQINENFLLMNGREDTGDLYKKVYTNPNWEKHTNKDEGTGSITSLLQDLQRASLTRIREILDTQIEEEHFINYSVASLLTSNWDGYWNNNWMYLNPQTNRWEIYPWDFDWLWGSTTQGLYSRMPLTFPLDGVATGGTQASRAPGPVTAPLHRDETFYDEVLRRTRAAMTRQFSEETLFGFMDETQTLILDDLRLLENYTRERRITRVNQINDSFEDIAEYIIQRREYLDRVLPVGVEEWTVY